MEEPENAVKKQAPGHGVKKQSTRSVALEKRKPPFAPTPTRSLALEQRKAPFDSPRPPRVPRWLILDRIVHCSSRRRCGVVPKDATASALAHDCARRPIRASLRIAEPPAVSRLYIHQLERPPIKHLPDPMVIAAHRNSILFRLTVPFKDDSRWHHIPSFPNDYFVYSCRSSSPPSLTLLPPCFEGGITRPKYDWSLYQPHCSQQQRSMLEEEIGILSHGDQGEFTVAQLNFSGPDEFELSLLGPATSMEWNVVKVKRPTYMKVNAYSWRTDVVVPMPDRCLCWVDYYQGLLLIDVCRLFPDGQPWIHHVPLPYNAMSARPYQDGGVPDPFRCVSVTDAGALKLVCILTEDHLPSCPFTIRTWTLDYGRWTMDANVTMGTEGFFRVLGAGCSCLPRVQPSFPLVSLVDPDVICFLLDDLDCGLFWTIEVNMRNKQLHSSTLYINEEEEEGYPPKTACRNNFSGHQFIPSMFSSYLTKDAITSRKLSETMQKAKEERELQKSRLKTRLKK